MPDNIFKRLYKGVTYWMENLSAFLYYVGSVFALCVGLGILISICMLVHTFIKRRAESASIYVVERAINNTKKNYESEIKVKDAAISKLSGDLDAANAQIEKHKANLNALLSSNLTAMPWLAGMMSDFLTYDLEVEAKKLEWGHNVQREKKIASVRAIRADAQKRIEEAKIATYELEYLRTLYPALDDILETDYKELNFAGEIPEYDPVREYLSREEWLSLSQIERDQLALDRYVQSHNKSKWQTGRDYELSVAYEYRNKGYVVDTTGSYMQLEDMGRDVIAKNEENILIIQCKYWSSAKTIHEKHIMQLYGTCVLYQIENHIMPGFVRGLFITNTKLSDKAKSIANALNITVVENHPITDFPRIKCNIGRDEFGPTKIYHLPMDAQYDITQIKNPGEFYAFTVKEAVDAGFRRAFRWHGQ